MNHFLCWLGENTLGVNLTVGEGLKMLTFTYGLPRALITTAHVTERNFVLALKIIGEILKFNALDEQIRKKLICEDIMCLLRSYFIHAENAWWQLLCN